MSPSLLLYLYHLIKLKISDRRPTDRRAQRGEENFGGRPAFVRSEIRHFGGAFAGFFPISGPRVEIQLVSGPRVEIQ